MKNRPSDDSDPSEIASDVTGVILYALFMITFLLGVSVALTATPITTLMINNVPERHRTMASATLSLSRKLGSSLSMGTVMLMFSLLLGSVKLAGVSNNEFLNCMRLILYIFAVNSAVPLIYSIIHVSQSAASKASE